MVVMGKSGIIYEENYSSSSGQQFWNSQPAWAKTGFRVVQNIRKDAGNPSPVAQEVWKLIIRLTIGYKEGTKIQREIGGPSKGVVAIWEELRPRFKEQAFTIPYWDPVQEAVVLYEEDFGDAIFWQTQVCWSSSIGFRVLQPRELPETSLATILPPEILLIVCYHAQRNSRGRASHVTLTCRAWAVGRQQIIFRTPLRTTPVGDTVASMYVALVARFAKTWWLSDSRLDGLPSGWARRYLPLFTASRRRLPEFERQYQYTQVMLLSNYEKISLPHRRLTQCRSLFPSFPRSLPPSCMPILQRLVLVNYHFCSFSDFTHLIWELPGIRHLSCHNVDWDNFQVPRLPTLRTQPIDVLGIDTRDCADPAPFVLILTSIFMIDAKGGNGILSNVHALPLLAVIRSLLQVPDAITMERNGHNCKIRSSDDFDILEFKLKRSMGHVPHHLDISEITLALDKDHDEQRINWTNFAKYALSIIPDVEEKITVTFPVKPSSKWGNYSRIAGYIVSQIPEVWESGKLRFRTTSREEAKSE